MYTSSDIYKSLNSIGSYIYEGDITIYQKYASLLVGGSHVLDACTGRGVSAMAMAMANSKIKVTTVDDGSTILNVGWVKNEEEYRRELNKQFEERNICNINFIFEDIFKVNINKLPKIDMFHLDDEDEELEILRYVMPLVVPKGLMLIRNYNRFKDFVDPLCSNCDVIDSGGLIRVFRKP